MAYCVDTGGAQQCRCYIDGVIDTERNDNIELIASRRIGVFSYDIGGTNQYSCHRVGFLLFTVNDSYVRRLQCRYLN